MAMSFNLKEIREVDPSILTSKERQKALEAFVAFDKNGSKMIEKEEQRFSFERRLFPGVRSRTPPFSTVQCSAVRYRVLLIK